MSIINDFNFLKATVSAVSLPMRLHADALCSFWAMMAIVMQNTAVCRGRKPL